MCLNKRVNIWSWLFPRFCLGCGRPGSYVCSGCVNRCVAQKKQVCPECGKPSMFGRVHAKCRRSWGMGGVVAVLEYRGVAKRLVGKIKYKGVVDMYGVLVEILASVGDFTPLEGRDWLVVGVPLHKRRQAMRGFNQAEMLGERVAKYFGWEYWPGVLVRQRYTKPQVNLKRKDRLVNVKNAFCLNAKFEDLSSKLKGKDVLLVDDVWTTGATLRECAKVLKRVGVRRVWGLVVAS